MNKQQSGTEAVNRPTYRSQLDAISAAVFQAKDDKNGSMRRNVSLQKRYFDNREDEWKSTTCYLAPSQVSAAIRVLQQVEKFLLQDGAMAEEPVA